MAFIRLSFSIFLLFFYFIASAQQFVPGQFLVEFKKDTDIRYLIFRLSSINGKSTELQAKEQLIPGMNIWLLTANANITEFDLLEKLRTEPNVIHAQLNHKLNQRSTQPNDPQFSSQWQYINTGQGGGTPGMDIDADLAWDITQGGLTAAGDTIVVAVIDDGANINHTDLAQNLWVNRAEIYNGIDDDANGYIDDYLGWNSNTLTDNVGANGAGAHGTSVAGIIGAIGNNNIGVSGVNWKVKIMLIRNNFNTTEANILSAYGYALTQRKIYNQTNGQQGAFVVATNASWGVDNLFAAQAPLWCSFYDTLGKYGIINVASTTNNNVNVDIVGDLPTTCTSDYLIAVTNLNRFGTRNGGYGPTSVDLGAFADGVFTLTYSGYGIFGGTSAAAPHVTGAIALAYSTVCGKFMSMARVYPQQAAFLMKEAIISATVPNSALNTQSVTGGQLNLCNTLLDIQNTCPADSCFAPFGLNLYSVSDSNAIIDWAGGTDSTCLRIRYQGTSVWLDSTVTDQYSYFYQNLSRCKHYEVVVNGWCNGIIGSSETIYFSTEGCCMPPSQILTLNSDQFSADISWTASPSANTYQLRWREYGQPGWTFINTSATSFNFNNINPCSYFEIQIRTDCGDTTGAYSASHFFATNGCTSCLETTYCDMRGTNTDFDWIESFRFANFFHRSGANNGYHFYDSTIFVADAGTAIPFTIEQGNNFLEAVRIWIDINHDGDFSDADEKVFEGTMNFTDSISSSINLPYYAAPGVTRMRVALQWSTAPTLCSQYQNGETEDYCLQILPGLSTSIVEFKNQPVIYPNPGNNIVSILNIPIDLTSIKVFDIYGKTTFEKEFYNSISNNYNIEMPTVTAPGFYFIEIKGIKSKVILKYILK